MHSYSRLTDADLATRLKAGDEAIYTEIFNRYHKLLIAHAFRLLGNRDEANDVVQDVFLALWQKKNMTFSGTISAYLYTAIRNRILNQISHEKVVSRYADSIINHMNNGHNLADEGMREKELAIVIEKEINALPEKMRQVFLLNKKEEMTYQEISVQLGITDKTAKQQVYNALKILKHRIDSFMHCLF